MECTDYKKFFWQNASKKPFREQTRAFFIKYCYLEEKWGISLLLFYKIYFFKELPVTKNNEKNITCNMRCAYHNPNIYLYVNLGIEI